MDKSTYVFLNHLDTPIRFLALTIDELMIASIVLLMLVVASQKLIVCLLGGGLIQLLRTFKKGGSPRILLVLAYWYLPRYASQFFLPHLPPSYQRIVVA